MSLLSKYTEEAPSTPSNVPTEKEMIDLYTRYEMAKAELEAVKKQLDTAAEIAYKGGLRTFGDYEVVERTPAKTIDESRIDPEALYGYQNYCRAEADTSVNGARWRRYCKEIGIEYPLDGAMVEGTGASTYVCRRSA